MASPASDTSQQDLQDVQVSFDLDAEKVTSTKRPFVVRLKDREGQEKLVTLIDPEDIDYKVLLQIEKPRQFLSAALSPEDRAFMNRCDINGATFGKLIDAFMRHYGLDNPGNGVGSLF